MWALEGTFLILGIIYFIVSLVLYGMGAIVGVKAVRIAQQYTAHVPHPSIINHEDPIDVPAQ
jgi:ABC-type Na+ efflux pump permease subunit